MCLILSGVSDVKLDMATHDHVRNVSSPVRNVSGPVRNVSGDAVRSCPKRVSGMSGNVRYVKCPECPIRAQTGLRPLLSVKVQALRARPILGVRCLLLLSEPWIVLIVVVIVVVGVFSQIDQQWGT